MPAVDADFGQEDLVRNSLEVGTGTVHVQGDLVRFQLRENDGQKYSNAQIDDYHKDGILRWRPPLELTVRARFSESHSALRGTAGFGFWNDPFDMTTRGGGVRRLARLRLPQAVWFFYAASPSEMALAMDIPGFGWKAATIDASGGMAMASLPFAPLGMLACRWAWGYRLIWPLAQRILKIDEALLPVAMEEWHEYRLLWHRDTTCFHIDGKEVLRTAASPRGPLGLVVWMDNQYMVATPSGRIHSGVVATGKQWMEVASMDVVTG